MSVNLVKGQKVELRKNGKGQLRGVVVGLGWDEVEKSNSGGVLSGVFGYSREDIDCDANMDI